MAGLQMWKITAGAPGRTPVDAKTAEDDGWYGLRLADSQCLAADTFIELAMASSVTSTLMLGTGVTNPVMRPVATLADAAATVQVHSDGRLVLGIGRGDSSLAHVGLAPAPVGYFERFCERLRPLLRGEEVPFDLEADNPGGKLKPVDTLELADAPDSIKLRWLPEGFRPVPLEVTATGPRMVAVGARIADRLSLAVGTDPVRVKQNLDFAREQRAAAGLDPTTLAIGIYATVVPMDDREKARPIAAAASSTSARFSVMHGKVTSIGVDEKDAEVLKDLYQRYDMNQHSQAGNTQAAALTDDFLESFCIFGPPGHCVERLQALADVGVDYVIAQSAPVGVPNETLIPIERALSADVLPHVA